MGGETFEPLFSSAVTLWTAVFFHVGSGLAEINAYEHASTPHHIFETVGI